MDALWANGMIPQLIVYPPPIIVGGEITYTENKKKQKKGDEKNGRLQYGCPKVVKESKQG